MVTWRMPKPALPWTRSRAGSPKIGEVASFDFWGLRDFAYEINHKTRGYYSVIELRAEPGAMDPVERYLRIADGVVRHKLIRLPDDEAQRRGLLDGESANSQ